MSDTNTSSPASEEENIPAPAEDSVPQNDLASEIEALKNDLLRAMAETDNVRKRAQKEKEEALKYGIANFARELTSVSDNLRRALTSIPESALASNEMLKALYDGVVMTESTLLSAYDKFGIKKISPLGEKFDHSFHQAMLEIETPDSPPGTIVQVLQDGYTLHDRLLKPALVGVAKAPVTPS